MTDGIRGFLFFTEVSNGVGIPLPIATEIGDGLLFCRSLPRLFIPRLLFCRFSIVGSVAVGDGILEFHRQVLNDE